MSSWTRQVLEGEPMPVIRFDAAEANKRNCPHPYPAARGVPAWMKKTPREVADSETRMTVKRCPPFLGSAYVVALAGQHSPQRVHGSGLVVHHQDTRLVR